MNSRHITKILDNARFGDLSAAQLSEINSHVSDCPDCRAAFQSARIASILLRENSNAETILPAPFFQTKVLNAWREKQIAPKRLAAFWHWWQASATLVVIMFLTVIGLVTATVIGTRTATASRQSETDEILYSPETVILNQKPSRSLTTEQVFEVLDENK